MRLVDGVLERAIAGIDRGRGSLVRVIGAVEGDQVTIDGKLETIGLHCGCSSAPYFCSPDDPRPRRAFRAPVQLGVHLIMPTSINGHTVTAAQLRTLDLLRETLALYSGDSAFKDGNLNVSPRGDGRSMHIDEVFGRHSNRAAAHRRNLAKLDLLGVLRPCEIEWNRTGLTADGLAAGHVRWKPLPC